MKQSYLKISLDEVEQGTCCVKINAFSGHFSAQSSLYVNLSELSDFSENIARYPLIGDGKITFMAGFHPSNENYVREIGQAKIEIWQLNSRGTIQVNVTLLEPVNDLHQYKGQNSASIFFCTEYGALALFSNEINLLVADQIESATLCGF